MESDVRWKQRFQNFCKAFSRFSSAVDLANSRPLSDLERQELIQSFEFTQELSWKVVTEFGLSQNHRRIISAIFSKYPDVEEVLVYESRAKGTFRPGADIDMIITKKPACRRKFF